MNIMRPVVTRSSCARYKDIIPSSALSIRLDAVRLISLVYVGTAAAAGRCGLVRLGVRHLLHSIGRGAAAGITTPVCRLRAGAVGFRHRDPSVLASPLDAFVAILVQRREIFPQLLVHGRHGVAFAHCRELEGQVAKGVGMELVLMGLQKGISGSVTPVKPSGCLTFRLPNCVNCFPQPSSLHKNGFACSWTMRWARTLPRWAKRLPQLSQEYGRSPVWRRSCVWKTSL